MNDRILIVDDEPNLLRMLGFTLEAEGYTLLLAKNGQEALQKFKREQLDLAILDVMLPDMSGLDICKHLRKRAETVTLPIIMLSARGHVPDKIAGLEAGADEYVTKPIDPNELVARVGALLARTRRLRQQQGSSGSRGRVLGFIGAKGGTGTTTVALNVAAVLARDGKTVTAVELRSHFGTFSTQLGNPPPENLGDLLDLEPAQLTAEALSARLARHRSGLRLLFGPQKVEQYKNGDPVEPEPTDLTEQTLGTRLARRRSGLRLLFGPQKAEQYKNIDYGQAEAIVKGLAGLSEYTIVDLPACPSEANQAALRQCDFTIMVVEPGPSGLKAGKIMLDLLQSWGVKRSMVGAVVVNHRSLRVDVAEMKAHFDCEVVGIVPSAGEACWVAQAKGLPLVHVQPESLATHQIEEIAGRLSTEKVTVMRS